jgi:formylglycine-generating enzyme required for sulfatase activity
MRRDTGWTALHAVYWTTNDPKSWNTGTQRVVRDNHYAENLQTLSTRNFETPATANATTGFRLVRRP